MTIWRSSTLAAMVLAILSPRAQGQHVFPYSLRLGGTPAEPQVGKETVLGGFVEAGQHLAVYCHVTRAGMESEARHLAGPKLPGTSSIQGMMDSGEIVLLAFGTPVRVVRIEKLKVPTTRKVVAVELLGGPYQGESVYVWPIEVLRHKTKVEIVAEQRSPRLPDTLGSPMPKLDNGKLVMLGQLDLKSPVPDVHHSGKREYPVLALPIPAFARMESFRAYFANEKVKARRGAGHQELPVATRVIIERVIPQDGEPHKAAIVSIAFDPGKGETFIIPADCIIVFSSTLVQLPEWTQRRSMPDYSPESDRHPRRKKAKGSPKSDRADPNENP